MAFVSRRVERRLNKIKCQKFEEKQGKAKQKNIGHKHTRAQRSSCRWTFQGRTPQRQQIANSKLWFYLRLQSREREKSS